MSWKIAYMDLTDVYAVQQSALLKRPRAKTWEAFRRLNALIATCEAHLQNRP